MTRLGPALLLSALVLPLSSCGSRNAWEGKSVTQLIAMLRATDPVVQTQGALGLGYLGAGARSAVGALTEALQGPEATVRQRAAWALGQIGPDAAEAVPALTKALQDSSTDVRQEAAQALGNIGPAARSAIPALEKLKKAGDPCHSASAALKKLRS